MALRYPTRFWVWKVKDQGHRVTKCKQTHWRRSSGWREFAPLSNTHRVVDNALLRFTKHFHQVACVHIQGEVEQFTMSVREIRYQLKRYKFCWTWLKSGELSWQVSWRVSIYVTTMYIIMGLCQTVTVFNGHIDVNERIKTSTTASFQATAVSIGYQTVPLKPGPKQAASSCPSCTGLAAHWYLGYCSQYLR